MAPPLSALPVSYSGKWAKSSDRRPGARSRVAEEQKGRAPKPQMTRAPAIRGQRSAITNGNSRPTTCHQPHNPVFLSESAARIIRAKHPARRIRGTQPQPHPVHPVNPVKRRESYPDLALTAGALGGSLVAMRCEATTHTRADLALGGFTARGKRPAGECLS